MPFSAKSDRDRGQAAVELALCLPVVMLMLLGIVQVAVVVRDQLLAQHAAREAARAASVADSPQQAAARVLDGFELNQLSVGVVTTGDVVRVEIGLTTHTDVPLIGALVPDVVHSAIASMTLEPP